MVCWFRRWHPLFLILVRWLLNSLTSVCVFPVIQSLFWFLNNKGNMPPSQRVSPHKHLNEQQGCKNNASPPPQRALMFLRWKNGGYWLGWKSLCASDGRRTNGRWRGRRKTSGVFIKTRTCKCWEGETTSDWAEGKT